MIDRQECRDYKYKIGFKEGELDCLFINKWTTIEQRAEKAFYTMGLKTYKKQFIDGYVAAQK